MGKQSADKQAARFMETARQLGADEDEASFKAKLAVITRQTPHWYEITPAQRKQIEAEIAREAKNAPPPSVEQQLAEAEAELAAWRERFDGYTGNNPRKFQTDIRRAAARVRELKTLLDINS